VTSLHPTKTKLIETAVSLIDEFGPIGFTVDALLERSSISKGSLYHHFVDFSDVIEQAQVIRFSRYIDEDIKALFEMLSSAIRVALAPVLQSLVAGNQSGPVKTGGT
jgi:AcrR family transcriptional regulator